MSILKSRYFPEKEFASKDALFADLRKNYNDLIAFKKAEIQKSCEKGLAVTCKSLDIDKLKQHVKALKVDSAYYYIAVNTTNILDSHEDLHIPGIWNKSVKEQQGQNYLVADHELCIDNVIVRKEYIEMFTAELPFAMLGKAYDGNTEALIYKVPKDKVIHSKAKEWLESGDDIEASVRMQYITILFAMDSNDPEDATLKKNYDEYLSQIANKADFEYILYYFIVKEAKNVRESSLVVFGSNPATGNIRNSEPGKSTLENKETPNPQDRSTVVKSNYYFTI
ncbi:hypothetical protein [Mucilaginibacter xinganensis]|uniref:Structural protein n=1 Tax=Mucilaginibacter xinganensis TaxID=1234841 RepID=A0A223NX05_9SPHI|nr:hypothetical protein [Mucilaginibacter xinganensis]ASU34407.1 structural protein [Mucilaginibacter xinganensis]